MSEVVSGRTLLQWLDPLTDAARLRLLHLLDGQELSVGELSSALQLPQSTVSRHLKRLFDSGWVVRRSEGTASLYRRSSSALDEKARKIWSLAEVECRADPQCEEDTRRAAEIISQRSIDSRKFFGTLGGEWAELRNDMFGAAIQFEPMLSLLDPSWVVADLGCGTGASAAEIAPWVSGIEAIDREEGMLEAASSRLQSYEHVRYHQAELTDLPLEDASVNAALISLVLHHMEDPLAAIEEALRIVEPGGPVIVVDMVEHDRALYRDSMGHMHLGFSCEEIESWASKSGCERVRIQHLRPDMGASGPGLFVARFTSPAR